MNNVTPMEGRHFNFAVRLTFLTAIVTALLAGLKLTAGYQGHSHALFADGIHSIADIFIDLLVLLAAHYGGLKADHNHPYGHGRIETAAVFGVALILLLAGAGIVLDAGKHIWGHIPAPVPQRYVLWVAVIAMVVNEILFRYTLSAAKKNHSTLLEANAWHSRSDAAVSLVVLLGVAGAIAGWVYLDVIGAIFVGILIGKMGISLAWKSISELVDTGVNGEALAEIKAIISSVEGVKALHLLRTRTVNSQVFVDVHVLVSPHISVSEGHFIGDEVARALNNRKDVCDVTVHVDPEDDENILLNDKQLKLPSRSEIVSMIESFCREKKLLPPQKIQLHYLSGKCEIELFVSSSVEDYGEMLNALKNLAAIKNITIYLVHKR